MTQTNAAQLFKAVKQDQVLKERLKAATNPEAFIKIAKERGYDFTVEELQTEISKLSEEELAGIVNPGVAPRSHIYPR
ncbi:Nif11-like leader peptide family natural product precursor [Brasilonema bromeliae]|uniref:Nif11-like leader peptide family natural product n=1 Tax=Brasilonema bromeliae SPC951 TaxID=385972 RepID=A0ABX1PA42_9CYAN|nr:Nif11-like leader peptide family natural product precursor [Brasilonema bromeliae]NMG20873.1 Nif11-like leader peptide family natural product precursor [Brasilonema bromeliae SPC951]